ncbi:MAG: hypothetical protein M3Y48_04290 [Actinomycetota bacterium]|nr:hypothetical protein [Actinomycetota bacterium]
MTDYALLGSRLPGDPPGLVLPLTEQRALAELDGSNADYYADVPPKRDEPTGEGPDSWAPIDLGPYLRGEIVRPEPSLGMVRTDGLRLLYPGKEHAAIGEMESGKSWFALASVAVELNAENHVVYAHFEECDPSDSVDRLIALGVRDQDILRFLHFVGPERQVSTEALAGLLEPVPTLVVFDGVNEAMALHRWAIREEDGAAEFRRRLVKPCTKAGAAVLSLDHVVKDTERRSRNALGSIHKGNGLSGSLILLENNEPFGRGQRGRSHVYITKDRPGFLRRHGRPDKRTPGKTYVGELVVDDTGEHGPILEVVFIAPKPTTDITITDAATSNTDDDKVYAAVCDVIATGQQANGKRVRAIARMRATLTDDCLARLVMAGRLDEQSGPNNSRIYIPTVRSPHDQLAHSSDA